MRSTFGFARTLVFSALAAFALLVAWLVLAPVLGAWLALGLPLLGALGLYVIGLAPDRRSALNAALLVALLGVALLAVATTRAELGIGAAVILALVRSAVLFPAPPLRAIALECTLVGVGLALAGLVGGPGPIGAAVGLWTFGLVQGAWFLVGGARRRTGAADERDPFDLAHARLCRMLEEEPGRDW
jgi:hypothetical protein